MNWLTRIACRIAKVSLAGDIRPKGVTFELPSHVTKKQVEQSELPEGLKSAFVDALSQKDRLQVLYNAFTFDEIAGGKSYDKVVFAKAPVVDAVRFLTDAVRSHVKKWIPKFDTSFQQLANYEFPFDVKNAWYIDLWVQYIHEFITAMFVTCGGHTYQIEKHDDVPEELRQPDWPETE